MPEPQLTNGGKSSYNLSFLSRLTPQTGQFERVKHSKFRSIVIITSFNSLGQIKETVRFIDVFKH